MQATDAMINLFRDSMASSAAERAQAEVVNLAVRLHALGLQHVADGGGGDDDGHQQPLHCPAPAAMARSSGSAPWRGLAHQHDAHHDEPDADPARQD